MRIRTKRREIEKEEKGMTTALETNTKAMETIVNSKIVIGPYLSDIFWIQIELGESKKAVIVVYHFRKI